jgi:glutathione-specific gamma-glutamylcyclotransferase
MSQETDLWLFGYGSLVWRPDFEHRERRPAVIAGWTRRFWQGSTDHRGVPGAPGRVVTLIAEPGARCHGVAYRVAPDVAAAVLAGLDHRERGGYARVEVAVELSPSPPDTAIRTAAAHMYVATADNPSYLGPAPLPAIARQIHRSRGPSGANLEYLLRLAAALREQGAADEHVFALEREALALQVRASLEPAPRR